MPNNQTGHGPHVGNAMEVIHELDARGLMPLDDARAVVAETDAFERERGDVSWAALLSLADADEAIATATRWTWRHMPRGRDNVALVERYGAAILPWLRSRVVDGVLINAPWCVVPCVMAIHELAALELLWSLRGVRDRVEMLAWSITDSGETEGDRELEAAAAEQLLDRWISANPAIALAWLVERDDARARAILTARAERGGPGFLRVLAEQVGADRAEQLFAEHGWPRTLTITQILAVLDAGTADRWPEFNLAFDGRQEYFGLRLIAARERDGEGWGVVFERLCGSYPGCLFLVRFGYGSGLPPGADHESITHLDELEITGPDDPRGHLFHGGMISGPAGELRLDEGLLDRSDLRPGKCTEIGYHPMRALAIRTYLAHAPGSLWPPVDDALAELGLDDPELIVISDAFAHVIGCFQREGVPAGDWQVDPSESPTMCSLAAALVERNPALFDPGQPNTDWRLHAYVDEPVAPAWEFARVSASEFADRGHLRAAMAEAEIAVDERGLMPLADARVVVAGADVFCKGEGRQVAQRWVQDSDRLWAALLSLADADEFAAAMVRLRWDQRPRGGDTLAPIERFGESAVVWLRANVRERVLHVVPDCLRANLLGLDADSVVDLLVELEGVEGSGAGKPQVQLDELREQYLAAHRPRTVARLATRAREHADARALLRHWALLDDRVAEALSESDRATLELVGVLTPEHVLARLDHHARRPAHDLAAWPRFVHGTGPADEFHGLRLIAARASGDRWAIVLERASGYGYRAAVRRYIYGRGVGEQGHREELDLGLELEFDDDQISGRCGLLTSDQLLAGSQRLCEQADFWTGPDGARRSVAALRSYIARWPAFAFVDPAELLAAIGLDGAELVVATDSFEHVVGPELVEGVEPRAWQVLPSVAVSYRSLAELIATGDRSFLAGESNVDWRLHARFDPE